MIYGSVCSGIEAATVAWHPLWWKPAFFSEIDKFPRAVLAHHYPDVPLHGDFTDIQAGQYEQIGLLVGGTPCQSFSIAGLRGGMGDDRGNLALEFFRLADRLHPRWIVWENVPGVLSSAAGRDFGSILGALAEIGYGFAYRVLDAQYFGVPQRRRRVFVVGYFGDWRRAAAVLFERESLRGDSPPRRTSRQDTAPTISARPTGGGGLGTDFDLDGGLDQAAIQMVAHTLSAARGAACSHAADAETFIPVASVGNRTSGPLDVATAVNACHTAAGRQDFGTETFIAHPPAIGLYGVRRITPREAERLQGFPDDYTLIPYRGGMSANGPRYKALGNSMAVPVMRWIGERIDLVERTCSALPTSWPVR